MKKKNEMAGDSFDEIHEKRMAAAHRLSGAECEVDRLKKRREVAEAEMKRTNTLVRELRAQIRHLSACALSAPLDEREAALMLLSSAERQEPELALEMHRAQTEGGTAAALLRRAEGELEVAAKQYRALLSRPEDDAETDSVQAEAQVEVQS